MEGGELFSRIQERADTAFTERGLFLLINCDNYSRYKLAILALADLCEIHW